MVQPRHTLFLKIRKSERLNLLIKADLYQGRTSDFDVKKIHHTNVLLEKAAILAMTSARSYLTHHMLQPGFFLSAAEEAAVSLHEREEAAEVSFR